MAISSPVNFSNISGGFRSLRSGLSRVKTSTANISNILLKRTTVKREAIAGKRVLQKRREENIRRKEHEDLLEASGIKGAFKASGKVLYDSTKGFLGRIMDFLGTLLIGWMLYNLPTILTMINDVVIRVQKLYELLTNFVGNLFAIFRDMGGVLDGIWYDVTHFDFLDTHKKVQNSLNDLNTHMDNMRKQFDDGIKLVTTALGKGPGEETPASTGTEYPLDEYGARSGRATGVTKQALDIIAGPESGGNYNAFNQGQSGDRPGGSKKWLGKNLTDMTIGEVLQRQAYEKDTRNPRLNNYGIWAAGRYQIIPGTFEEAVKNAGLKPTDMFSPANQDKMGIAVLKSQGIGAWTVGGSRYTARERAIISQAQKTTPTFEPVDITTTSAPSTLNMRTKYQTGANLSSLVGRGVSAQVTSNYGEMRASGPHLGLDIAAPMGTYIALRYDCEVVFAGQSGNYGNVIDVWVPQINRQLRFGHLSSILVSSGRIPAGKSFARVGMSGHATGPHIHLECDPVKGGTKYGGSTHEDPSPYVSLLLLTAGSNAGSFAPVTPGTFPAQISRVGQTIQFDQQITPERNGQTIAVMDTRQQQVPMQVSAGGGDGGIIAIPSSDVLNSFIKQNLLLDLAYT